MFNVVHWVGYKILSMTSPSLMVMNPMKSDLGASLSISFMEFLHHFKGIWKMQVASSHVHLVTL
jgi:hypothetical protein